MYKYIKVKVTINGVSSKYFPCNIGVRQDEHLSPFLFSIFLNDLEDFLQSNNAKGIPTITAKFQNELDVYLNLLILLYADRFTART